ncbi:hypothetical protein [Nonomuraea sp. NPDC002799]
MYKHAIAAFSATSAALLLTAGPVAAEAAVPARCSDYNAVSVNLSPPPPLAGDVDAAEVAAFLDAVVTGRYPLTGVPDPAPGIIGPDGMPPTAARPLTPAELYTPAAPPVVPLAAQPVASSVVPPVGAPGATVFGSFLSGSALAGGTVTEHVLTGGTLSESVLAGGTASVAPDLSPVRALIDALVARAMACYNDGGTLTVGETPMVEELSTVGEMPTVAEMPALPQLRALGVAEVLEALALTSQSCATATQEPGPATLLGTMGVPQLVGEITGYPTACAAPGTTPAAAPESLLDSIGVVSLLGGLLGR